MHDDVIDAIATKIIRTGALVEAFDPEKLKYQYTQPRGTDIYQGACRLTKNNKLYCGPKLSKEQLAIPTTYETRQFLYSHKLIDRVNDPSSLIEEWRLTDQGVEFFYVYTQLLHKQWKKGNQNGKKRLGTLTMMLLTMGFYAFYKMAMWAIEGTKTEVAKRHALKHKKRRRKR